jgi:hypothetical protein
VAHIGRRIHSGNSEKGTGLVE